MSAIENLNLYIASIPSLNGDCKTILSTLLEIKLKGGIAKPSYNTMAKWIGRSIATVTRCIRKLIHEGWIKRTRRGKKLTNIYTINRSLWWRALDGYEGEKRGIGQSKKTKKEPQMTPDQQALEIYGDYMTELERDNIKEYRQEYQAHCEAAGSIGSTKRLRTEKPWLWNQHAQFAYEARQRKNKAQVIADKHAYQAYEEYERKLYRENPEEYERVLDMARKDGSDIKILERLKKETPSFWNEVEVNEVKTREKESQITEAYDEYMRKLFRENRTEYERKAQRDKNDTNLYMFLNRLRKEKPWLSN